MADQKGYPGHRGSHAAAGKPLTAKGAKDESEGDDTPTGPAEAGKRMTLSATAKEPARVGKPAVSAEGGTQPPPDKLDPHGVLAKEHEDWAFLPGQTVTFTPSGAECTVTDVKTVGPEGDEVVLYSLLTKDLKHAFDVQEDQIVARDVDTEKVVHDRIMAHRAKDPKRYGLDARQAKEIKAQEKERAAAERSAAKAKK